MHAKYGLLDELLVMFMADSFYHSSNQFNFEDRTHTHRVFSIDGPTTRDFDDAFSVCKIDNQTFTLSIYIANIAFVIDN